MIDKCQANAEQEEVPCRAEDGALQTVEVRKPRRIPFDFGDHAAIMARIEAKQTARRNYRNSIDTNATFCTVDLGDWLDLCRRANVPFIPAEPVAEAAVEDLCDFETPGEHQDRVIPFWAAVKLARRLSLENSRQEMLRWSCCSGSDVKYHLGNGRPEWNAEFVNSFSIDDPRSFDLVHEFPKTTIQAWIRPWLTLLSHECYPVEFRAFVENDKIVGISSYYPQRALPLNAKVVRFLTDITNHVTALIAAQHKPLNCPELPHSAPHIDMAKNCWTADFAVSGFEQVLFLEGGPPHTPTFGAHPCCFPVGEIEGIALRPRKGMAEDVARALASAPASSEERSDEAPPLVDPAA